MVRFILLLCGLFSPVRLIGRVFSRRDSAAADALLETCVGALDLLLELSETCAALMSPYANVVGDLVLGGGGAV